MTWVLAGTTFSGSAVIASDTQVTWSSGGVEHHRDCLQKSYLLDRGLIGGFAGSVSLGFRLLGAVSKVLRSEPRQPHEFWSVGWLADRVAALARVRLEEATEDERACGSELLLVGVEPRPPDQSLFGFRAVLAVLRGPEFIPDVTEKYGEFRHIGSGSEVTDLQAGLAYYFREFGEGTLATTTGRAKALASVIGMSMAHRLSQSPIAGISKHMHVHVLSLDESVSWTNDTVIPSRDGSTEIIKMPRVARSRRELMELLQSDRDALGRMRSNAI